MHSNFLQNCRVSVGFGKIAAVGCLVPALPPPVGRGQESSLALLRLHPPYLRTSPDWGSQALCQGGGGSVDFMAQRARQASLFIYGKRWLL